MSKWTFSKLIDLTPIFGAFSYYTYRGGRFTDSAHFAASAGRTGVNPHSPAHSSAPKPNRSKPSSQISDKPPSYPTKHLPTNSPQSPTNPHQTSSNPLQIATKYENLTTNSDAAPTKTMTIP